MLNFILIVLGLLWGLLRFVFSLLKDILSFLISFLGKEISICLFGLDVNTYMWVIVLVIIAMVLIVYSIYIKITNIIKNRNERRLKEYLEANCLHCQWMSAYKWKEKLPEFAQKMYHDNFESITSEFSKKVEKQYIWGNKQQWEESLKEYLSKQLMADMFELVERFEKEVDFTRETNASKIVFRAMEHICESSVQSGQRMVEKVRLEEDAIKKMHPGFKNSVPKEYLMAYKIAEDFITENDKGNGNLITTELSLDDLGIA